MPTPPILDGDALQAVKHRTEKKTPRSVTWGFFVAGAGFEPATFGL